MTYKVGIVGTGAIGWRIIKEMDKHKDFEVAGFAKTSTGGRFKDLNSKYPFYVSKNVNMEKYSLDDMYIRLKSKKDDFSEYNPSGHLLDLLLKVDVIFDATPGKMGINNKLLYEHEILNQKREEIGLKTLKVIYQGGEKPEVAESSFIANPCYDKVSNESLNQRVVSCNTTGMGRPLYSLLHNKKIPEVDRAYNTLVRRSIDPSSKKGSFIDAFKAEANSHHGHDLNTIYPNLKIGTTAFAVPMSHFHGHSLTVLFKDNIESEDVEELLKKDPRIAVINPPGLFSGDLFEISRQFWNQDSYVVAAQVKKMCDFDDSLEILLAVPQESIVIPESIDCANALLTNKSKKQSMDTTNNLLEIPVIKQQLEYELTP